MAQLAAIEPSNTGRSASGQEYRPCSLILKNGSRVERALCVEDHRGFQTDFWINPIDVHEIRPTPERMPAHLATKLYEAGESGMGYAIFRVRMTDGQSLVFVTGGIVDFLDLPEGYSGNDIQEVFPHEGREESKAGYRSLKEFKWCFYVKP